MKTFAVAGLGLLLSAGAVAGDFRFDYSAADLISPEQVEALHAKLENSAADYCHDQYPRKLRVAQKCVEIILEDVVDDIANPQLTAYQRQVHQRRES